MTATSAQPTTTAALRAPTPAFNAVLAEMHGPTPCLPSTMSMLTPFPAIAALPDATVLDLHISLSSGASTPLAAHTKARYSTAATATEATTFYETQLRALSDNVTTVLETPCGAEAHIDAALRTGHFGARVFDLGRLTTVIVQAESTQQLDDATLADLANWHRLGALDGATITQAEVFTVAAGICAPVQAIYSTEYHFAGRGLQEVRSIADALLKEHGWEPTETFENSLLFEAEFGGEAHISGADGSAQLTIVGEYTLPTEDHPVLN